MTAPTPVAAPRRRPSRSPRFSIDIRRPDTRAIIGTIGGDRPTYESAIDATLVVLGQLPNDGRLVTLSIDHGDRADAPDALEVTVPATPADAIAKVSQALA